MNPPALLESTIGSIRPRDLEARAAARRRLERLAIPHWSLGALMDLAEDLAGMTGSIRPSVARKTIVVMAGDHGVVSEGVSIYPQEITVEMVHTFVKGGAAINALARQAGAGLLVVDTGVAGDLSCLAEAGKILSRRVGNGTCNMAVGPAMSREEAVRCVEVGIETALEMAGETDLFGTGEMGNGNTTPSAAIIAALCGAEVAEVTGRGTGLDDAGLRRKILVIEKALAVNSPDPKDAIDVLAKVGGFEIGALAGLMLGAASLGKPVMVDGVITTAAALLAQSLAPASADYMIAAHRSVEKGQCAALKLLGKEPLLDLSFRLGEGTGAAVAMNLVDAAVAILTEVATFEEVAVTEPEVRREKAAAA